MYKVEFLNDRHDWILKSWHKNMDSAERIAEVTAAGGYTARIINEGKIIQYVERRAK